MSLSRGGIAGSTRFGRGGHARRPSIAARAEDPNPLPSSGGRNGKGRGGSPFLSGTKWSPLAHRVVGDESIVILSTSKQLEEVGFAFLCILPAPHLQRKPRGWGPADVRRATSPPLASPSFHFSLRSSLRTLSPVRWTLRVLSRLRSSRPFFLAPLVSPLCLPPLSLDRDRARRRVEACSPARPPSARSPRRRPTSRGERSGGCAWPRNAGGPPGRG